MKFTLFIAPIALFILFAVIGLAIAKAKQGTAKTSPRFHRLPALLSPAEQTFFAALEQATPTTRVFPKVRMADVITANDRRSGDFSRISQKHFDFLLCDRASLAPIAAIELDDSTHTGARQRKNDKTKNNAASDARLPVIRFRCKAAYSVNEITKKISDELASATAAAA